jgi:hypothetical protein
MASGWHARDAGARAGSRVVEARAMAAPVHSGDSLVMAGKSLAMTGECLAMTGESLAMPGPRTMARASHARYGLAGDVAG